ncbi:MAG: DUF2232 domain-containing protein, partial [Bacillati bacterium ANGP1]
MSPSGARSCRAGCRETAPGTSGCWRSRSNARASSPCFPTPETSLLSKSTARSSTVRPAAARPGAALRPARGLTEGAILAALSAVAAIVGLVAPFVGILLAPIPLMLLVIRWGLRTAVLAAIVAGLILLQFFGPLNAVSMGGIFAPLGLALGWGVRRRIGAPLTVL